LSVEKLHQILEELKPKLTYSEEEYEKLEKEACKVKERIKDYLLEKLGISADVIIAGSLAKRTMVKGQSDIDIFIRLSTDYSKEYLKTVILSLGEELFGRDRIIIRYAEHPYIEVLYNNLRFSVVPAYKVEKNNWKSPVDRTYYHLLYIKEKFKHRRHLCDDVVFLKTFLKKLGIYGAEIYTKGFSGYLCELLILNYNGFVNLIKAVAERWRPPIIIDIEGFYRKPYTDAIKLFKSPFIVIDPVDKGRNVAAVVSTKSLMKFISASKILLNHPNKVFFDLQYPPHRRKTGIPEGIHILAIKIKHGYSIPDILYSQVEKVMNKIRRQLESNGFKVFRAIIYTDFKSKSLITFLLPTLKLPEIYVRNGPFPFFKDEIAFIKKNIDKYIWIDEDGRWKVLERRKWVNAIEVVSDTLKMIKIPSALSDAEFTILTDSELWVDKDTKLWANDLGFRHDFWVDVDYV